MQLTNRRSDRAALDKFGKNEHLSEFCLIFVKPTLWNRWVSSNLSTNQCHCAHMYQINPFRQGQVYFDLVAKSFLLKILKKRKTIRVPLLMLKQKTQASKLLNYLFCTPYIVCEMIKSVYCFDGRCAKFCYPPRFALPNLLNSPTSRPRKRASRNLDCLRCVLRVCDRDSSGRHLRTRLRSSYTVPFIFRLSR